MELERLLSDTERLCLIDSQTGNLQGAERAIEALRDMAPTRAEVRVTESSSPSAGPDALFKVVGQGTGGVLLLGHYDTVPRSPGLPLFERDGDFVRGWGVCDMKSGLASMMALLRELSEEPESFGVLYALVVGDEEWRAAPLKHRLAPWLGVDGALGFERGQLDASYSVVLERYGAAVLLSRVVSESLRAEKPLLGNSAITAASKLCLTLDELDSSLERIQLTPTALMAPSAINVVPEKAEVSSLIRFGAHEQLNRLISLLPDQSEGCAVEHEIDVRVPCLYPSPASTGVARELEELFPGLQVRSERGAGDTSWIAEAIDLVLDGLGAAGDQEHSAHERAAISSFLPQYELSREAARLIIGPGEGRPASVPLL